MTEKIEFMDKDLKSSTINLINNLKNVKESLTKLEKK